MLQVLLILLETRTSIVLYTDMNTDIGANKKLPKNVLVYYRWRVLVHMYVLIYSY